MNRKILSTAVVVALGASAGSVLAWDGTNTSLRGSAETVNLSGATASTALVRNSTLALVCDPADNDIRVYRRDDFDGDITTFGNDWAVACYTNDATVSGINPPATNKNVFVRKRDQGGSFWGTTPVAGFQQIDAIQVSSANCSFNRNVAASGPVPAYKEYACGATDDSDFVPVGGFSDIEPDKFVGINVGAGNSAFETPPGDTWNVKAVAALVFNTPVSTNLRNALQAAQGLTVGSDNEANLPSLSSQEIRSLFTGGITNWNQLLVDDGGTLVPLASHSAVAAADLPGSTQVNVCRRVNGSGTQAQLNAIFLNYPCADGVVLPTPAPGNPFGGYFVHENSGSSDVGRCLDDFADASNNSGKNPGLTKRWAIGVQSTEKNATLSRNYRFIKVDGVAPTIHNVHKGDYYDFAEQSFQYWTGNNGNGANVDTLLNFLANNATTPADIAALNTQYVHPFGQGGWLVTPGTAGVVTNNPLNLANPVNTVTRAPFSRAPNTCQFPIVDGKSIEG